MTVQTVKAFNLSNKVDERLILSSCAHFCAVEMATHIVTGMSVLKGEREMVEKCDRLYNRLVMNMYMYLSKCQVDEVTAGHKGSMVFVRVEYKKTYAAVVSHRLRNDGDYPADLANEKVSRVSEAARKAAMEVEIVI